MLSIVIPMFNEEAYVNKIYNKIKTQKYDELILVDDGSSDKTYSLIRAIAKKDKKVKAVRMPKNTDMGGALRAGTKKAKGDKIIWTMADMSDDFGLFSKITSLLEDYDLVLPSRYMKGGSRGSMPLGKYMSAKVYSFFTRLLFRMPATDITNAFRGFKKEVFEELQIESNDFSISPEFAIKMHINKYKIVQIPNTYYQRTEGKSSFRLFRMGLKYGLLWRFYFKK